MATRITWTARANTSHELPTIPLRRLGTPADIADVVLLFASEQARWMTGQVVQVAGGHAL